MRKLSLSEVLPGILIVVTVITIIVVLLLNIYPPLKNAEIIDDSSFYSDVSSNDMPENNYSGSSDLSGNSSGSSYDPESGSSEPQGGKININTATVTELMTLDGIGEVKAKAIVEYREANGYFKSIDDLVLVSGIGEKTLEKNRDRITV
ncbi:MAG: helix-hairpin-helix domain-containing protein [Oscillospiraceae bacterium]|nr:helix-hairpin-helix domain-containing protein [Oscillospiraceae bacterium]